MVIVGLKLGAVEHRAAKGYDETAFIIEGFLKPHGYCRESSRSCIRRKAQKVKPVKFLLGVGFPGRWIRFPSSVLVVH